MFEPNPTPPTHIGRVVRILGAEGRANPPLTLVGLSEFWEQKVRGGGEGRPKKFELLNVAVCDASFHQIYISGPDGWDSATPLFGYR